MAKKYYAGAWRCHDCTHSPIDGMLTRCPISVCNQPRNAVLTPEEQTWLPPAPRLLTDPDDIAKVKAGRAWNCGHCGEFNWGNVNVCVGCDRPKSSDDTLNRRRRFTRSGTKKRTNVRDEVIEWDRDKAVRIIQANDTLREVPDWEQPVEEIPRGAADIDEIIREDTVEYPGLEEKPVTTAPPIVQKLRPFRRQILIGAAVVLIIVLSIIGVSCVRYLTATVPGTVTVTGLNWDRSVGVEEYRTLHLEGWDHPYDARVTSSDWRWKEDEPIYGDVPVQVDVPKEREVPDTYDCSTWEDEGSGNWTKDEKTCPTTRRETYYVKEWTSKREIVDYKPIYDWYYYYQVDRWQTDHWVNNSGTEEQDPSWPEPNIRDTRPGDHVGDQKVGDRKEAYTATYTDSKGRTHADQVEYGQWVEIAVGEEIDAWYNKRTGNLSSVDWSSALDAVPAT